MPGVRRILCNNPSPFTFKGTVSYIVGRGQVAIVDPGPLDEPPHRGAARCGARRDRDAHLRHPHPSRPFAGGGAHQGGDRRDGVRRGSAPRRAGAQCRRGAAARCQQRHRFPPRSRAGRRRDRERRRLDPGGGHHARPYRQPHGLRAQGGGRAVLRRSRHGVVDAGGGAAGRRHERLHGFARRSSRAAPRRSISPATAAPCATRRASSPLHPHRKAREASILHRLGKGEADIPTIVRAIYIGLDPRLIRAAGLSVLAHLEDLVARGLVATDGAPVDRRPLPLAADPSSCPWPSLRPARPAAAAAVWLTIASSISSSKVRTRAALVPKSKLP